MSLASRYQQAVSALETLDGLIKRPRDRVKGRTYLMPQRVTGRLEAQGVQFAYPAEQPIPVIKGISFTLDAGQKLALLGRVGSGKSTLLRLMSGLYTPVSGSVRLDGLEMQQIEPSEVRRHMGYVGQDPQLFMGTLRENMVLSETWITDGQIVEVLKTLHMYELVAKHPRGLDMPITEAGGGLSGGQRQLISIARMMLRDPKLVFMDEPTANMDQNTEAHVIAVMSEWLQGRTLMMSTHRPQLLVWADLIGVIDAGLCVALGPKDEMLAKLAQGIDVAVPNAHRGQIR
jgi:ATP-binding cassette subfamily C protein LapB